MTDISALEVYAGELSEAAAQARAASQVQHDYVHGDSVTDVPTESGPLATLAKQAVQAQDKVSAALIDVALQMAGAMTYTTTAAGLAGTVNDGYFSVPSADSNEYLILYQNAAGVAVEKKRYPSVELVNEIGRRILTTENLAVTRVPLVATESGQVAVWLENGLLSAPNLSPDLREAVTKDFLNRSLAPNAQMLPLMLNNSGQVVIWLEKGRLNAAGLSLSIRDMVREVVKTSDYSPTMLPLMYTEGGQVALWMKDGKFNAAGLHTTINELIQTALQGYATQPQPKHTDGSTLYLLRSKIAKILAGYSAQARILFQGDSWSDHLKETAQALNKALGNAYGRAGTGWLSMNADEGGSSSTKSQLLNDARLYKVGWTLIDMVVGTDSLDGHAAVATGTTSTISISNLKTEALKWYYKDGNGTFRYSVDGGSPVTVVCGNTGNRASIDIAGLTDTTHSIVFDLIGNAGTVTFYGGMATRTAAGIEFSKAGNGGSTAVQWNGIATQLQAYSAELKPDVVIIVLGTNDKNQSITKAAFKAGLQGMVNAHRVGSPHCSIILMTPILSGSTADMGLLTGYAEAMYEISQSTANVEFINLNSYMPPRLISDSFGVWSDSLHLSDVGGEVVAGLLMNNFLKTN